MTATWLIALGLCLFGAAGRAAAGAISACTLPRGLDNEIAKKFPGAHLVSLADLDDYRKKLHKKEHGSQCPGLVSVNFYGDGKATWALVLISGENPKRKAALIVARKVDREWEIHSLDTADGTPVVWREEPGKYEGLYEGDKTIHAANPIIVFCGYESWAIVYSWNGKEVEKVSISD